jgi:spore maturation protein CgeB
MRITLISPRFHGYHDAVSHGFASLGHEVRTVLYDERSVLRKIDHKLAIEIPTRLGLDRTEALRRRSTERVSEALDGQRPDFVVVIKGDEVNLDVLERVRRHGVPFLLWLQDELHRTSLTDNDLARFSAIASYSALDVRELQERGLDASLVAMAFDDRIQPNLRDPNRNVVFVGARYPGRARALEDLVARGIPVMARGRSWSPALTDRMRTLRLRTGIVPGGPDVDRQTAGQLYLDAALSLNLHGEGHDGFNPRTFEVCGVGGLEAIDRPDVGELYEPGLEILTFSSLDEVIEAWRRQEAEPQWGEAIRRRARRRTLAEHTFTHRCRALLELC